MYLWTLTVISVLHSHWWFLNIKFVLYEILASSIYIIYLVLYIIFSQVTCDKLFLGNCFTLLTSFFFFIHNQVYESSSDTLKNNQE